MCCSNVALHPPVSCTSPTPACSASSSCRPVPTETVPGLRVRRSASAAATAAACSSTARAKTTSAASTGAARAAVQPHSVSQVRRMSRVQRHLRAPLKGTYERLSSRHYGMFRLEGWRSLPRAAQISLDGAQTRTNPANAVVVRPLARSWRTECAAGPFSAPRCAQGCCLCK